MKCVLYARVSSKDQEREGFSIPAQKKLLMEYALKNNLRVVQIFEEAETAKRAGRTKFKEMLSFLNRNPEVKDILVEKTDRLYRNFRDYTDLDCEQMGIRIHLVKENAILSKDSKSGEKFHHGIKVLMAKNYSDNLSEEVRKGQTEKAEQGIWPSCAPIGYLNKLDDRTVIPDPKTAPLIKRGFEMAATGQYSLAKLKRALYLLGLRSAKSKKELGKAAMSRILRNPIYFGNFSWKGKIYQGKQTPIINRELFDQVQIAMGFAQKPRLTKKNFAFAGIISCGHCGCAVTGEEKRKKSGRKYVYYHCTNGRGKCANVTYLREEVISNSVETALRRMEMKPEVVEWTRIALLESSKQEQEFREESVKNLNMRYQKLNSYISMSYQDKLEGKIEPELWESMTAQWKVEQQTIEIQVASFREANTKYLTEGVRLMELASRAAELFGKMQTDEKREMLNLVL